MLTGDVWSYAPAPQLLVDAAVGLGFPVIAAVIAIADVTAGARTLGRVMLVSGVAAAFAALSTALALVLPPDATSTAVLVQLQGWLWVPGFFPLITLVPLLYPDGLLPGRGWRLAALGAPWWASSCCRWACACTRNRSRGRVPVEKPVTSEALALAFTLPGALLVVPAVLAGLGALVVRFRSSHGVARRQVGVLVVPAALLLVVTLAQGAIPSPWDVLAQAVAILLLPLAIGVAVTRHGLYDLDTAVRRALVAASLAVCLAGLYVSVLAVLRGILGSDSAASAALAAGTTGVVLQPLAKRLSAGVDRLYYGDRANPYAVLALLGKDLAAAGAGRVERAARSSVTASSRRCGSGAPRSSWTSRTSAGPWRAPGAPCPRTRRPSTSATAARSWVGCAWLRGRASAGSTSATPRSWSASPTRPPRRSRRSSCTSSSSAAASPW